MLRKEIQDSARALLRAIEDSAVVEILGAALGRGAEVSSLTEAFNSYGEYRILASKFSSSTVELIHIMGLDDLSNPVMWNAIVEMLEGEKGGPGEHQGLVLECHQNLYFTRTHLPKLIKLLERKSDKFSTEKMNGEPEADGMDTLTTLVLEDRAASTPNRIIFLMESIQILYETEAELLGERVGGLSVISCDSGSDKSFDFLGVAKIMEEIKATIVCLWDRLIYYKEGKFGVHIKLIAESLPVIEKITDMHKNGDIEAERAEILKKNIFEALSKFVDAGVVTPEIEKRSVYNPRELLAPEPKLLAFTPPESENETDHGVDVPAKTESAAKPTDPEFEDLVKKIAKGILKEQNPPSKPDEEDTEQADSDNVQE